MVGNVLVLRTASAIHLSSGARGEGYQVRAGTVIVMLMVVVIVAVMGCKKYAALQYP